MLQLHVMAKSTMAVVIVRSMSAPQSRGRCFATGPQTATGPTSGSPAKSPQSVVKKLGTTALKFWRVRDVSAK